jgi:hypothetical protein
MKNPALLRNRVFTEQEAANALPATKAYHQGVTRRRCRSDMTTDTIGAPITSEAQAAYLHRAGLDEEERHQN